MTERDEPQDPSQESFSGISPEMPDKSERRQLAIRRVQELTARRLALQEQMRTPHLDERDEMRLNDELRRVTAELDEALAEEEATRARPPEGRIDP